MLLTVMLCGRQGTHKIIMEIMEKMRKVVRRLFSIIIAFAMICSYASLTAWAVPEWVGSEKRLSSLSVGSSVWINMKMGTSNNGNTKWKPVEFIVVHQGRPSSSYDSSCNGTWLLKRYLGEIYGISSSPGGTVDSCGNANGYAEGAIHTSLNNESSGYLSTFGKNTLNAICEVKIPYSKDGKPGTVQTGANGLSAKVFVLSGTEIGYSSSNHVGSPPVLGSTLSYFSAGQSRRVAYYSETSSSGSDWTTRTPTYYSNSRYLVASLSDGGVGGLSRGYFNNPRPAMVLNSGGAVNVSYTGSFSSGVYTSKAAAQNDIPSAPTVTQSPLPYGNIESDGALITAVNTWTAPQTADESRGVVIEYSTSKYGGWTTYTQPVKCMYSQTLYFRTVDTTTGVWSECTTMSVKVDTSRPYSNVSKNPAGYTSGNVNITVNGYDNGGSGFNRMKFNGSDWSTSTTNTYTVTENGAYTLELEDKAGNTLTQTVTVDNIDRDQPYAPIISAKQGDRSIQNGGWASNNVTVTISTGSGSDVGRNPSGVASYQYSTDGGTTWVATDGTFNLSDKVPSYRIIAKSVSSTGILSEASDPFIIGIDKESPKIAFLGVPEEWVDSAELQVVATDVGGAGIAKVYFYDENDNKVELSSPYRITVTANGVYTFEAEDAAGNSVVAYVTVAYIIGDKPFSPVVTLSPSDSYGNAETGGVLVTIERNSMGVTDNTELRYSTNRGATWTDYIEPFYITESCTLQAKVISLQTGAQSNVIEKEVLADIVGPTYHISKSPTDYTAGDVTITVTGSDIGSGFSKMRFNGSAWSDQSTSRFTVSNNGSYELEVMDVAGNVTKASVTVSTIDRSKPASPTITCKQNDKPIANGGWGNATLTLTFGAANANPSGVSNYQYSLDGGATWTNCANTITLNEQKVYTVLAKTVSSTGIVSDASDAFTVGIDKAKPSISLAGAPSTWVGYADLRASVSDTGGSGIDAVYCYTSQGSRTEIKAPYVHRVYQNGTYTFEVVDAAGNPEVKTITVSYIDAEPPEIVPGVPSEVELAADRSYAIIHLSASDVGAAGFAQFIYPNGSATSESEASYKVTENGVYTFIAVDKAGNRKNYSVAVSGIALSGDTGITVAVTYGDNVESITMLHSATETIAVAVGGVSNAQLLVSCNSEVAAIEYVNGTAVARGTYNTSLSLGADQTTEFTIEVRAADGTTDSYRLIITSKNAAPTLEAIDNRTTIEKSRYTEAGIITGREYTPYETGREGIVIQITACDANVGQYISGVVAYEGINYPVEWGRLGSGELSYKSDGKAKKGYIIIPVSAFFSGRNDEDISNSYAYVNLFDSLTPGGETISGSSTSNNSIRIQTDVNAPEVAYRMANTKYAVYLTVTDSSSIAGIEVTLTPTNGTNAGTAKTTTYTQKQLVSPIVLESGTNYTMRVVAKDVAGHVADVIKTISYSSGIAGDSGDPGSGDPGSADQPVDFTDTEGGVYSYKTRKGNYYLVGSSEKNTDAIKGSCKSFFYYGQDIA